MDSITNPGAAYLDIPRPRYGSSAAAWLRIHRYLPVAAFYFFFNRAGLPVGLFYTTLFAPLLYIWLYTKGQRWLTSRFLLVLSPFILAQGINGVASWSQYARSVAVMWTVYVAVYAFCWALMHTRTVDRLLEQLIVLNCCAGVIALMLRPTPLWWLLWDDRSAVPGAPHLLRMNLPSTTEPWAYGQLMLPLLLFTVFRLLRDSSLRNVACFTMVLFPFLLCQSFGGISLALAGSLVLILTHRRRILRRPESWILIICLGFITGAFLLIPNPIAARVTRVIAGGDGSANLRAFFAYPAAYFIASSKSLWWGVGIGQLKQMDLSFLGHGIDNTLPNAVSQNFAELGIVGVCVRFAVEFYLFARTRVYRSSFRTAAFIVAFLSQLTGSYLDDVQSYLLWLFAFYPLFP
ncbi:MAG: hypothetical protein WBE63_18490, partial [Acidobacteriaceae bacterium]